MRNKIFAVGIFAAVAAMSLAGAGIASAQSFSSMGSGAFQTALINLEANVLGLNPVVIQLGMMRGESLAEIAYENGIDPVTFQADLVTLNSLIPQYIQQSVGSNQITRVQVGQWNNWWQNEHHNDQTYHWNNNGNNGNGGNNGNHGNGNGNGNGGGNTWGGGGNGDGSNGHTGNGNGWGNSTSTYHH